MLKNMKIRTRLLLSYMIIVLFLLIAGIVSIVMLRSVGNSLQEFYDTQFQTVDYAWTARRSTYALRASLLDSMFITDTADVQEDVSTAKEHFQYMQDAVTNLRSTYQGNTSDLDTLDSLLNQASPILENIYTLTIAAENDEAYELMFEQYVPIMDQVRSTLTSIGETADANATNRVEEGATLATSAVIIVIVIMVISVVFSVVLGIVISEGIRKPVTEMQEVSEKIAAGDFNVEVDYESKDELGDLADNMRSMVDSVKIIIEDIGDLLGKFADGNFNIQSQHRDVYQGDYKRILDSLISMRDTMNDTLSQIEMSADQVNSGSEQVSSGAQALAQGAAEQASSVEELAATINDISTQVNSTAAYAQTAKTEDEKAHDEIQVCSAHMDDLVAAMQVINEKSSQVSNVIKTIEDISFQTNILALNAAVEAARAGAAGKGFAVVADEVRNLASKSAEAAKSTTILIEETIQAVARGTKISAETAESLSHVVENAKTVLDAVLEISKATEEQSRSVSQVSVGIDQVSSVVQSNSATAEESAAASEELSGQANLMKELVGHFTLMET